MGILDMLDGLFEYWIVGQDVLTIVTPFFGFSGLGARGKCCGVKIEKGARILMEYLKKLEVNCVTC